MASKVFVDANVILDYVLKRNDHESIRVVFQLEQEGEIRLYISSSIVHIVGYWLTKYLGNSVAKITILKLLNHIKVVDGNHETILQAFQSDFIDTEDAIQYYIAIKNKMDYLVSFDKEFQKLSSNQLPIVGLTEFKAIFANA